GGEVCWSWISFLNDDYRIPYHGVRAIGFVSPKDEAHLVTLHNLHAIKAVIDFFREFGRDDGPAIRRPNLMIVQNDASLDVGSILRARIFANGTGQRQDAVRGRYECSRQIGRCRRFHPDAADASKSRTRPAPFVTATIPSQIVISAAVERLFIQPLVRTLGGAKAAERFICLRIARDLIRLNKIASISVTIHGTHLISGVDIEAGVIAVIEKKCALRRLANDAPIF